MRFTGKTGYGPNRPIWGFEQDLPVSILTRERERLVDRARKLGIAISPSYWRHHEEFMELREQVLKAEKSQGQGQSAV